jgi:hypothetical protein
VGTAGAFLARISALFEAVFEGAHVGSFGGGSGFAD